MESIESKVRAVLRARGIFDLAARQHAARLEQLRIDYPRGPRGGRHALLRDAEKRQKAINDVGAQHAFGDLVDVFSYEAERWLQMTDPDVTVERPFLNTIAPVCRIPAQAT